MASLGAALAPERLSTALCTVGSLHRAQRAVRGVPWASKLGSLWSCMAGEALPARVVAQVVAQVVARCPHKEWRIAPQPTSTRSRPTAYPVPCSAVGPAEHRPALRRPGGQCARLRSGIQRRHQPAWQRGRCDGADVISSIDGPRGRVPSLRVAVCMLPQATAPPAARACASWAEALEAYTQPSSWTACSGPVARSRRRDRQAPGHPATARPDQARWPSTSLPPGAALRATAAPHPPAPPACASSPAPPGTAAPCSLPQVTLVDQGERFVFKPLLYELITGTATPGEVAPPFADVLAPHPAVGFVRGRVAAVRPDPPTGGQVRAHARRRRRLPPCDGCCCSA
jgi:hypothetical protein